MQAIADAEKILQRYADAASRMFLHENRFRSAQADYETAMVEYRHATAAVVRLAAMLNIKPRGGPGTWSL